MQQLVWNTLEVHRNQARAVMMYRIVNGLIAIPASLYLTPNTQNTTGHGWKFRVPAECVDAFNYSFFLTTIRIWNQLPADVVMFPSIEAFKVSIDRHLSDLDVNLETFILFLSRAPSLQYVFICQWNLDLSVVFSTSCTSAMHEITQLWGMCIIGKEERRRNIIYVNASVAA